MKRILIVEDDGHLQVLLREELMEEGYDVVMAANGAEALATIHDHINCGVAIDLVIMDIRMPSMDGLDALGHIIKSALSVPIIVHTAYAGYKDHPIILAADAYIIKSHDLCALKEAVGKFMRAGKGPGGRMVNRAGAILRETVGLAHPSRFKNERGTIT